MMFAAYRRLRGGAPSRAALQEELAETRHSLALLRSHVAKMDREAEEMRMSLNHELLHMRPKLAEIARLRSEDRAELVRLLALLRAQPRTTPRASSPLNLPETVHLDGFYEGFERRFRGSREEIRSRLADYLPDVASLTQSGGVVLDIGPGHGEWLELLREHGVAAYGVDTNERFVALGRERGLDVRHEDAIAHLQGLEPQSLAAVTVFHVIEHLGFDQAVELVDQCLRALRPGGTLLIETPNPLNLRVGAAEFWIDPTHLRPMHPQL
ncbi:MAG TPA: class I SAM-dependent methyltransferase, partial [Dehalococcoidia bacterium]|nr:class I SAM-dependent methyltransferase [Dehalococcoidia bacterium]